MNINNKLSNNPVIFIPGILGSMSDEIILGTGEWSFGPAMFIYDRFIDSLVNIGYSLDENLFICYYDWRKNCSYTSKKYLKKIIDKVKLKTHCKKIDLICHSMGGLVARDYILNNKYKNYIDNLIMLGTPNAGSVNAYGIWAEGKLSKENGFESQLLNILLNGYVLIVQKINSFSSTQQAMHEYFSSIEDLLPSNDFGNFLFYLNGKGEKKYIKYKNINYKNKFLDSLNKRQKDLCNIKIYLIGGDNCLTNSEIGVEYNKGNKFHSIKDNQKILEYQKSIEGDGTVLKKSIFAIKGMEYIVNSSHGNIIFDGMKYICRILSNDKYESDVIISKDKNNFISVMIFGKGDLSMNLIDEYSNIKLSSTGKKNKNIYLIDSDDIKWIIYKNLNEEEISLNYISQHNENVEVIVIKDKIMDRRVFECNVKNNNCNKYKITLK